MLEHKSNLVNGLSQLGLKLNEQQIISLLKYLKLLQKWNRTYSLTAINNFEEMIYYHLLDGLSIIPYLKDKFKRIIDVGSGMGVPGVIIAICYPLSEVVTIDCNNKKTTFLKQVAIELNLTNLVVINSKVEQYLTRDKFDIIVSRAFSSSDTLINFAQHLLKDEGIFLSMKGRNHLTELATLKNSNYSYEVFKLNVPGIQTERFLLKISNIIKE